MLVVPRIYPSYNPRQIFSVTHVAVLQNFSCLLVHQFLILPSTRNRKEQRWIFPYLQWSTPRESSNAYIPSSRIFHVDIQSLKSVLAQETGDLWNEFSSMLDIVHHFWIFFSGFTPSSYRQNNLDSFRLQARNLFIKSYKMTKNSITFYEIGNNYSTLQKSRANQTFVRRCTSKIAMRRRICPSSFQLHHCYRWKLF